MNRQTVLLVDDDPFVPRIIELSLRRAGLTLVHVATLAAARAAMRATPPDLIILELHLPDGKGYDLLHHVRVELGADTPIIVFSGLKQTGSILKAVDDGANDYVVKPFSPRDLVERVDRAMRATG